MTPVSKLRQMPIKSASKKTKKAIAAVSSAAPVTLAVAGVAPPGPALNEAPQAWTDSLNCYVADVVHALRVFAEEIARRHCTAPVLYGNCQGGWAVALLAADCEGLDGPAVLNGSPLFYWAGAEDVTPMRLAGGLLGGGWLTHLMADLGGGRLDGAWLAKSFEKPSPASSLWQKNCNLYANVDTERERFLEFERWWPSYYFLRHEEILCTVENLFIDNRLGQAQLRLKQARQWVSDDNPWHAGEQAASKSIADALEQWRVKRDAAQERLFTQLYGET